MKPIHKLSLAFGIGYLFMSFRKKEFVSPVKNFAIRDCDPHGCGAFGASRIRNGVSVDDAHNGIDIIVQPGDEIVAPMSGTVRTLYVYGDSSAMKGLEISNGNKKVKIFYLQPDEIETGEIILKGEYVGKAQDIAGYHNAPSMTPHIHLELYIDGVTVDPTDFFN